VNGENVGEKHLTSLEIKLLIQMVNRLVIDFLLAKVIGLVNGLLSDFVSRILSYFLCGYVEDDGIENGIVLSGKIRFCD
jgi:hypothetical protein